jgi:glycosyltransferase involved in cell wall biosynthesis
MKSAHIVHLSAYPVDDVRNFQKACKSEIAEGYQVTQIVCHDHDEMMDGVAIVALPTPQGRLSRMLGWPWRMARAAMRQRADIYVFNHPELIPAGILLKLAGKKVIYETHEFYPDKILSMRWIPPTLRPLARAAFAAYERIASALWDHVIVTDRYTAKAFTGRPVSVVPNYPLLIPVEPAPARQDGKRTLLYVGGLSDERGLGVMLKIAALLQDRNVELHLMGPAPYPGDEERIRRAPNVQYFGNRSLAEVYKHLATADLGLMLFQPVPAYAYAGENTLKLFEYMWSSLPIVSSNFPNLKRIIEAAQCGICIDPCHPEPAAEAILELLDQPDICGKMGANGRKAVAEAYNWPAAREVLLQVYRNVLSGNRSTVETPPLWDGELASAVSCDTRNVA